MKRLTRGMSLRARVVLLVVASLVPLLGFRLSQQYRGYQQALERSGERTLDLARSMALVIESELERQISVLQTLVMSQRLQDGDLAGFRTLVEDLVAQQLPGS